MKYIDLLAIWSTKKSFALSARGGEGYINKHDTRAFTRPENFIHSLFNFIFAFGTVMYHRIHKVQTSIPKVKSSLGGF